MNIFRLNCGKIKPGPKSKSAKLKLKLMDDEADEVCDGGGPPDNEEDEVNDGSGSPDEKAGDGTDSEGKMEGTDKKKGNKVNRQKKEGLLDIDIDEDCEEENEDEEVEEGIKKRKGGISLNEKIKKHILMSSDEEADEDEEEDQKGMYCFYCIVVVL